MTADELAELNAVVRDALSHKKKAEDRKLQRQVIQSYIRLRYFIPVVISRSGFEGVLPFPETIFPQITYCRSRHLTLY